VRGAAEVTQAHDVFGRPLRVTVTGDSSTLRCAEHGDGGQERRLRRLRPGEQLMVYVLGSWWVGVYRAAGRSQTSVAMA